MLSLRKVAVTGGLSCGKSLVCRLLKKLGAYVISSDDIVHQLLSSNTNPGQEIIKLLGNECVVDGKIDRSRVAKLVFHDFRLLKAVEEILHPAVYNEIERLYREQSENETPPPLFIAEVPLLFESGGESIFDCTVVVIANPELCIKRFIEKTGYDVNEFEKRMSRQLPIQDKVTRADYVILNNGSIKELEQETDELYQKLVRHVI